MEPPGRAGPSPHASPGQAADTPGGGGWGRRGLATTRGSKFTAIGLAAGVAGLVGSARLVLGAAFLGVAALRPARETDGTA